MNVLPTAHHGQFHCDTPSPYGEGTIAHLTCQDGFVPEGVTQSILVLDEGQWRWNPPSTHCVPALNRFPVTYHGEWTCDQEPPYREGAVAHLQCWTGYEVASKTQSTLIQEKNHLRWDPPSLLCLELGTNTFPVAEHGSFVCLDRDQGDCQPPYKVNSAAKLVCDEGYASPWTHSYLYHDREGNLKWSPPFARCEPAVNFLPSTQKGEFVTIVPPPYRLGTLAFLECDDGYASNTGTSQLVMKNNHLTWDPPLIPCEPALFYLPDAYKGKFITDSSFPYREGTVARLTCEEGYGSRLAKQSVAILDQGQLKWTVPYTNLCEPALYTLPKALHGEFLTDESPPYVEGTDAHLVCDEENGYGTKSEIVSIVTHENGQTQWKPPSAECIQVLYGFPHESHGRYITEGPPPYVKGDKATLHCDEGYTLFRGSETTAIMYPTGLGWYPIPMCVRYLTVLPVAVKGTFTSHKKKYYVEWDKAKLTCDAGYTSTITESVVKAVQRRDPNSELVWDPAYVKCVPKTFKTNGIVWLLLGLGLALIIFCIWWKRKTILK